MSKPRPMFRPNDHQRDEERKELHQRVDTILGFVDRISNQARTMGDGFPSSSMPAGSGHGGSGSSIVERLVVDQSTDLSQSAQDWQARFARWKQDGLELERSARGVLNDTIDKARALRALNDPDPEPLKQCGLCKQWARKVIHVSEIPFCRDTCYKKVTRSAASVAASGSSEP